MSKQYGGIFKLRIPSALSCLLLVTALIIASYSSRHTGSSMWRSNGLLNVSLFHQKITQALKTLPNTPLEALFTL